MGNFYVHVSRIKHIGRYTRIRASRNKVPLEVPLQVALEVPPETKILPRNKINTNSPVHVLFPYTLITQNTCYCLQRWYLSESNFV